MRSSVSLFVLISALSIVWSLPAQGPVASVSGEVQDPSGAIIPSVAVTARNTETNVVRSTVSNESGVYTLVGLPPGTYELSAEVTGFKRAVRTGLVLEVAQAARIDFKLELGGTTDVVNITAEAPVTDTETASTGTVIDNKKVVELPLNGRQFYNLALLVPGATLPTENSTLGFRGGFNVSGRAETNNNFSVNGIDNNDEAVNAPSVRPSVDDIQEFKLLTGVYTAEYGRSAGGQVIVVTKSGTNDFHGTAFEFLRNQKLDAANYFTQAGAKPSYRRNDFGATIGGPIVKNKTFFHFSYEGLRLAQQVAALGTVPTAAEDSGDFSTLLSAAKPIIIKNPLTGVPFVGNSIPQSLINPVGQSLLKQYPAATVAMLSGAPTNNYFLNGVQTESMNEYSARVDHNFSSKDTLYGSYLLYYDPTYYVYNSLCGSSVLPNGGCYTGWTGQLFALVENHIFSPGVVNEVRLGVQRMRQPRIQTDSNVNFWGPFNTPNVGASVDYNTGIPNTRITGYSTLGGPTNLPQNRWDTTYDYRETLSWQKGTHAFKFGAEYRPFDSNFQYVSNGRGVLTFNASTAAPTSGYALADALLGYPTTAANNPLAPPIYGRTKGTYLFAQDDWKISTTFTLNLGLRWELNSPYVDAHNNLSTVNLATGLINVAGVNGVPSNLYAWDYKKLAPRVGFAYQPFKDSKTVIRGGAGVFYDNVVTFNGLVSLFLNPPMRAPATYTSSVASPITLNNPFPLGSPSGNPSVAGIVPDYTTPNVYEWSFGIQRQISEDILLDVTYLASKGLYLPDTLNLNQPAPGPGTAAQVQARRPYPAYANFTIYESGNQSIYNSLQVKLEKRYSKGLALLLSETFAKSIDDGPQAGSTGNSSKVTPQNAYNVLEGERGLSDFNVKNRLVLSIIGELPFGKGKPWLSDGFGSKIAGGWQLSSITSVETGRPWTPYFSGNISNTSQLADRPNAVAGCNPYSGFQTVQAWVNPACFTTPASGTFGNLGRNTLIGPGLVNIDFAVDRNFQLWERLRLQFRGELFNIFNHPNFNLPSTAFDSPTFGSLPSAMDPREIQFGVKLIF
jgi:hypothetical protein